MNVSTRMMAITLAAAILAVVRSAAGANLQWKVAGCDLYQAVLDMPAANDGFQLHQVSGTLTFTLSDDASIENLTIDPRTGTIMNLDFSADGNHTLSLTKSLILNPNNNGHINFVARDADSFAFDAPLHSTHLFYYGDGTDELLERLNAAAEWKAEER